MSPIQFFKGMAPAIIMAFSSASSMGTLPLNLECTEKLGAKKDIASFVLPLGATTLASIGTAGVPGAGMVMLAMVLQSVGLPVEGIALVAGVDRIFDMGQIIRL